MNLKKSTKHPTGIYLLASLITLLFVFLPLSCATKPTNIPGGSAPGGNDIAPVSNLNSDEKLKLDPAVTHGTLENGLTYYIRPNSKPENRASLRLVVRVGSVIESESQRGLAHFVEHMAFNGTENYPKHEIIDYLEKSGMSFGPDINASTGFERTIYELDLPTDDPERIRRGIDILKEWAFHISFDPEEVEKERQVIIEEWRGDRGASARLRDEYLPVLFRGSRFAERMPIGLMEVIEGSSAEDLRDFYTTWYAPEHMAVIVVGNIDPGRIEEVVGEIFGPERGGTGRELPAYSVPPAEEKALVIATDPEEDRTNLQVMRIHAPFELSTVEDYRRSLAISMYREMVSSRLREKTEQADPPYVSGFFSMSNLLRANGVTTWAAAVIEGEVEEALKALLLEERRVELHGFSESELLRAKENIRSWMNRQYDERDKTDSSRFVEEYIGHFLNGRAAPGIEREWELSRSLLPLISLEEVQQVEKVFLRQSGEVTTIVTGPDKEGLRYPEKEELEKLFKETSEAGVEPYKDETAEGTLVPEPSMSGELISEESYETGDYHRFDLSNGARVFYKETDFRNEQILFSAFSPGGASQVENTDYYAARLAPSFIDAGKLGNFTPTQLQKILAGSQVNLSPYINELYEGFRGSGRPEDMETLLQLVYLYFTDVRMEEALFSSYQKRLSGVLENRLSDPRTLLGDRVTEMLFNGHPRRVPLDSESVRTLSPDQVYRVFRKRFASPSDFTFVFTGNVEPEKLKELAGRYLGSIPASGKASGKERWIDRDVRFTREDRSDEIYSGLEEKSTVYRIFPTHRPWSLEEQTDLAAFEQLLTIRLRETVREEAGGTYNVGVSIVSEKEPVERSMLSISFNCAPDRVDELNGIIDGELDRLRSEPVGDEYVEKVRSILIKSLEEARETNGFWLGNIEEIHRLDLEPGIFFAEEDRILSLTPKSLRKTAESYLQNPVEVKGVLYPEGYNGGQE